MSARNLVSTIDEDRMNFLAKFPQMGTVGTTLVTSSGSVVAENLNWLKPQYNILTWYIPTNKIEIGVWLPNTKLYT